MTRDQETEHWLGKWIEPALTTPPNRTEYLRGVADERARMLVEHRRVCEERDALRADVAQLLRALIRPATISGKFVI